MKKTGLVLPIELEKGKLYHVASQRPASPDAKEAYIFGRQCGVPFGWKLPAYRRDLICIFLDYVEMKVLNNEDGTIFFGDNAQRVYNDRRVRKGQTPTELVMTAVAYKVLVGDKVGYYHPWPNTVLYNLKGIE